MCEHIYGHPCITEKVKAKTSVQSMIDDYPNAPLTLAEYLSLLCSCCLRLSDSAVSSCRVKLAHSRVFSSRRNYKEKKEKT